MATVLCLTGSVVEGCFIGRAVHRVAETVRGHGHDVVEIDLGGLELPLFTFPGERAAGPPRAAQDLAAQVRASDALVLGVPEINGSMTGVLKNALDWSARALPDGTDPYAGLPVAVVSGSKHLHAGLRAADHAKAVLAALGCVVLPAQGAMAFAQRHFAPGLDGALVDAGLERQLDDIGISVVEAAQRGRLRRGRRAPWLDDLTPTDVAGS